MSEVILIYPPVSFRRVRNTYIDASIAPLGISYIASVLRENSFDVKALDLAGAQRGIDWILNMLEEEKPLLVGISMLTINLQASVELSMAIKKKFGSKISICAGGPHISIDPEFIYRFPYFDIAFVGEAEITFPQIVRRILGGERIKGIIYGELPTSLDKIPYPIREPFSDSITYGKFGYKYAPMLFSRGCPFRCSFCCIPSIRNKVRFRSAKNVVDEMEEIYKQYDGRFVFWDDTFTLNRKAAMDLCDGIIERGIKPKWTALTRVDLIDNELLKKMKRAGCLEISFGVESGNERIRNEIVGKKIGDEQINRAIQLCKKNNIRTAIFLMLGFPTETKTELYETVHYYRKLKPRPDIMGVHITIPFPGSKLYKQAIEEGVIERNVVDNFTLGKYGVGFKDRYPYYIPEGLSLKDLYKARRRAYYRFYFRPSFIIPYFLKSLKSWNDFKRGLITAISLIIHGRSDSG